MFWNKLIILAFFLIAAICGSFLVPALKKMHFGQTVREDGPKTHLCKSGTPNMGALMFIPPVLLFGLVLAFLQPSPALTITLLLTFFMAVIGFLDDYIKVKIKNGGLSRIQKTVPMLLICSVFVVYYLYFMPGSVMIYWPFDLGQSLVTGFWKVLYGLFLIVFMYFTINAVNLTDGVDGLLSTLSLPVFLSLVYMIHIHSQFDSRIGESLMYLLLATIGGLLGFLLFNHHPAKIFMGDTGSLALGALYTSSVVLLNAPWLLLFSGVIYFIEAMSVIIQGIYFKTTKGQRIFRMSPIHHHFELGGWSENKVVLVFSSVALLGSITGLWALL